MVRVPEKFDDIRAYQDSEVKEVIARLLDDRAFNRVLRGTLKVVPIWMVRCYTKGITDIHTFQKKMVYPLLTLLIKCKTDRLTSNLSTLDSTREDFLYISNHRDIVLDSALLDYLLINENRHSAEIGIGSNLLIYPWIAELVRLNRSFIVNRGISASELMKSSLHLSEYINFVIKEKRQSVWIAQREGRAKDSNDRTQKSLLKMLLMAGEGSLRERIERLNITPLSISYEYDPCDYLKAEEYQLKRDNPSYRKSRASDLTNMKVGILGYKGRVHYHIMPSLNSMLDSIDSSLPRNLYLEQVAEKIDNSIFQGYRLYPCNYIAYDMLYIGGRMLSHYSTKDRQRFERYIKRQLSKVSIDNPDYPYLREKILQMYANPLINKFNLNKGEL